MNCTKYLVKEINSGKKKLNSVLVTTGINEIKKTKIVQEFKNQTKK